MVYRIGVYKNRTKLGYLRDFQGKMLSFRNKREAITTANIESMQMEADGLNYRVVKVRSHTRKGKRVRSYKRRKPRR